MSRHITPGQQCQAIDMSQLADILAGPEIEILFETLMATQIPPSMATSNSPT